MTTALSASVTWSHNSDAQYRAWGSAICDTLIAAGGVRQTWTGQVDWATVLRPAGVNSINAYDIIKFNDGYGDYYLKIGFGTYNGALNYLRANFQFGLTHDGAGNLGPTGGVPIIGDFNNQAGNQVAPIAVCLTNGVLAMSWPLFMLVIERRVNPSIPAYATENTFVIAEIAPSQFTHLTLPTNAFCLRYAPGFYQYGPSGGVPFCVVPWGITASQRGADKVSLWRWKFQIPYSYTFHNGVSFITTEIPTGTVFSAATIPGMPARTMRSSGVDRAANGNIITYSAAHVWE